MKNSNNDPSAPLASACQTSQAQATFFSSAWGGLCKQTALLLVLCMAFGMAAVFQGRDASYDLKHYHAYNAYAFQNNRHDLDIYPGSTQVYYNPFWDLANETVIGLLKDSRAVTFCLGAVFGISAFFLLRILHLLFPGKKQGFLRTAAWIMGVTGVAVVSQLGITSNEIPQSVLLSASLTLFLSAIIQTHPARQMTCLCLAGFFAGAAAGAKLTAVPMAAGMTVAVLATQRLSQGSLKNAGIFLVALALGFALTGGWWHWHLYQSYGNPVFPYFNNFFQSPYFSDVSMRDTRMLPKSLLQAVFYPFFWCVKSTWVTTAPMRDMRFALVMVLGSLWLLKSILTAWLRGGVAGKARQEYIPAKWRGFWVFLAVSYALWMGTFSFYRYAIIIEMISGAAILFFLSRILPRHNIVKAVFMGLATLLVIATSICPQGVRAGYNGQFFQARTPAIPPDSLVLIMTRRPCTYLIRFFPSTARFCRVPPRRLIYDPGSDGLPPQVYVAPQETLLMQKAHDLILAHPGSVFVLNSQESYDGIKNRLLTQYGLTMQENEKFEISSTMDRPGLYICPALRKDSHLYALAPDKHQIRVSLKVNNASLSNPENIIKWWMELDGQGQVDLFAVAGTSGPALYHIIHDGPRQDFGAIYPFRAGLNIDGKRTVLLGQTKAGLVPREITHLCVAVTPKGFDPPAPETWEHCVTLSR